LLARNRPGEASEAHVKSQAHEGWKLIRTRYDDGGYSGGSIGQRSRSSLMTFALAGST
jgi:site-specific DNA recombinase